ncbi:efflux transporter outer membrane subunit [Bordetella muralis]|uniref:efflux transporter outer membrane subunit n=1 Tax=Bordetella muralis TaxID=1649130 RepID=UPI0039EFE3B4
MRACKKTSVLLLTLFMSGCVVGPDYVKPAAPESKEYLGQAAIDQRQKAGAPNLETWWLGFNDALLNRFVKLALAQNLDIAQASARLEQSRALLGAANAALLPSGNVNAQGVKSYQSVQTPLGKLLNATPDFDRSGEYYEIGAGASWELDLFGGLRRGKEAASATYEASEAGAVAIQLAVTAQTADTYVAIRGLQARLEIARQQAANRRRMLSIVELQYQKGVAPELHVRQAQGALAQVEASVPVFEAALDSAMNSLDVLLGVQPGTHREDFREVIAIPDAPAIGHAGTPADLIRRRPDLIAAERRLAAANARIGMAISEYFPKFSLGALLGTATTASGNLFTDGASQAQGVLGLRWRLFDFGRVDAQIAAARGQTAEALAAYRLAVLRASQDVEDAFIALVKREEQERTLAQGVDSFAHANRMALTAYQSGAASLIEVLDTDQNLLQTRDAYAQAQTEAARAAIASFRALGGGWELPEDVAVARAQARTLDEEVAR